MEAKEILYNKAYETIRTYICVKGDVWARLATIEAVLHNTMPYFFWTGVYALMGDDLIVHSYQGPVACQLLKRHSGVCWAAIDRNEIMVVDDVEKFPGHIACSSQSKSEIVLPLYDESGTIFGCFDIDSTEIGSFDATDVKHLSEILQLMYAK